MEFVNWDFYTAINVRRKAVLKTRLAEQTRVNFAKQPLMHEVCRYKLKLIAAHGSIDATGRLSVGFYTHSMVLERYPFC